MTHATLCPAAPSDVPGIPRPHALEGQVEGGDCLPSWLDIGPTCCRTLRPCPSPPNPAWPGNGRSAPGISLEGSLQGSRDGDESLALKIKS